MKELLWTEMTDNQKIWHLLDRIEALESELEQIKALVNP